MSIDYDLELLTNVEPLEVLNFLAEAFNFQWCEKNSLKGEGILLGVRQKNKSLSSLLETTVDSETVLKIWFQLDKFLEHDEGRRILFRVAMSILSYTSADSVLLYDNEIIIFQRINGKLVFNSDWNPTPPPEVNLPYEMCSLGI